jgi:hypothetical protein
LVMAVVRAQAAAEGVVTVLVIIDSSDGGW